jgi:hypothetical protein
LDRFTRGELAGKELLAAFLMQVQHARDHLTRLVAEQQNRAQEPAGNPAPDRAEAAVNRKVNA